MNVDSVLLRWKQEFHAISADTVMTITNPPREFREIGGRAGPVNDQKVVPTSRRLCKRNPHISECQKSCFFLPNHPDAKTLLLYMHSSILLFSVSPCRSLP